MTDPEPSFDDAEITGRRPRLPRLPLRLMLPSLVTLLAICSGLTAIRMSIEGRYDFAIGAVVLAAILDGIDGRVARLLKSTSKFGAELDSLADFVNFGVAPALILYAFVLDQLRSFGWIVALVLAISGALRLARFNATLEDPNRPAWTSAFFVGIPAPAGALTVLLPVYLWQLGLIEPDQKGTAMVVAIYTLIIGFLMVSKLPTLSGKKLGLRIPRDMVLPISVVLVLVIALLVSYPFEVLTVGAALYLLTLPLGFRLYRRRLAAWKAEEAGAVPAAGPNED
ncbi:CDP-diacylglycerol--serine O-phosphatidyltransferase [Segnochrobactraceae bacterium EtOH-i3]